VRTADAEQSEETNSGWGRGGVRLGDLGLCLVVAGLVGLLVPLDDADLPLHLLTGDWMRAHGALPQVEPFAWTRAGAPYFAYSWLPQLVYSWVWQLGGLSALSVLHAVLLMAVVGALWDLARVAGWSLWSSRLVLSLHMLLWMFVQPATRPQLVLAIALPIAWSCAFRVRHNRHVLGACMALAAASAVAVNSHLLFPLMAAPVVVLLAETPVRWSRVSAWVAALLLGWMCTPYLLELPALFRLNFGYNALFNAASPVMEHEAGFVFVTHAAVGTALVVALLLLQPLFPSFAARSARERWWYGLSWAAGLVLFGLAIRGLLLWWLLALPVVAWSIAALPLPTTSLVQRVLPWAWGVGVVGMLGQPLRLRAELQPAAGELPHPEARALAPVVEWLRCAAPSQDLAAMRRAVGVERATLKGTASFNTGSYLAWAVPYVSWSIDGRTIFPDSVARPEARQEIRLGAVVYPPTRDAQVMVLPAEHASNAQLPASSAWRHVALPVGDSTRLYALWWRVGSESGTGPVAQSVAQARCDEAGAP
jgi:hypothetical protein